MTKKELNVYYKGCMQKIKYYDSIDEDKIKKTVKQIFKINEPLEQIFFQDEDGDILVLNEHIPSGISIHIFVEPDSIPKNPSKELKIENKQELIKFHWIIEKGTDNSDKLQNVIVGKYIYTTVNDNDVHPYVRSSCTFEKGIHFFVLRKPLLISYSFLGICDENLKIEISKNEREIIGIIHGYPNDDNDDSNDLYTANLGILVDMEHKKCIFYDYDKKIKRKIQYLNKEVYEAPINFGKAKVVAWLKRDVCNYGKKGITILNEGCIPIPDWVK